MQTAHDAAVTAAAAAAALSGGNTSGEGGGSGTGGASAAGPGSPNSADSSGKIPERAQSSGAEQRHGSDAAVPEAAVGAGAGGGGGSGVASTAAGPAVESCLLLDLEKKPLLKVFVFLNATEVLRAAQVCRPMFRKVG